MVVALAALFAGPAAAATAPRLKDPDATGEKLATKFLTLLQSGDSKGLAAFLDPSFQIQRADGTGANRTEYLANPAKVATFAIGPDVVLLDPTWSPRLAKMLRSHPRTRDAQLLHTTEAGRLSPAASPALSRPVLV